MTTIVTIVGLTALLVLFGLAVRRAGSAWLSENACGVCQGGQR